MADPPAVGLFPLDDDGVARVEGEVRGPLRDVPETKTTTLVRRAALSVKEDDARIPTPQNSAEAGVVSRISRSARRRRLSEFRAAAVILWRRRS